MRQYAVSVSLGWLTCHLLIFFLPKPHSITRKIRWSLIEDYQQHVIVTSYKQEKTEAMAAQRTLRRQYSEMWRYPGGTWRYSQGIRKKVTDSGQSWCISVSFATLVSVPCWYKDVNHKENWLWRNGLCIIFASVFLFLFPFCKSNCSKVKISQDK